EAERVRHPFPVDLAVGCEGEHRLEQRLELKRGPDLADELRDVVARVPETVTRPGGNRQPLPGPCNGLHASDLEADGAAEDLEALLLARMDVRGGDRALR